MQRALGVHSKGIALHLTSRPLADVHAIIRKSTTTAAASEILGVCNKMLDRHLASYTIDGVPLDYASFKALPVERLTEVVLQGKKRGRDSQSLGGRARKPRVEVDGFSFFESSGAMGANGRTGFGSAGGVVLEGIAGGSSADSANDSVCQPGGGSSKGGKNSSPASSLRQLGLFAGQDDLDQAWLDFDCSGIEDGEFAAIMRGLGEA